MILSFLGGAACPLEAPHAKTGKLASRERRSRRIMVSSVQKQPEGGLATIYIISYKKQAI
jgi:hypothetical protein